MDSLFGPVPDPIERMPYDGNVPHHKDARDTEVDAAKAQESKAPSRRVVLLQWIRDAGDAGMTALEGSRRQAILQGRDPNDSRTRNTIAPRFTELKDRGFIMYNGLRREGNGVMVATDKKGDGYWDKEKGA